MKQFDNLVILFLISISPEGPAIKRDTQRQRNKEAGTLSGRHKAKKTHRHKLTQYTNQKKKT